MRTPEDASAPVTLKPICLRFVVKSVSACLTTTARMEFRGSGGIYYIFVIALSGDGVDLSYSPASSHSNVRRPVYSLAVPSWQASEQTPQKFGNFSSRNLWPWI
jgi:hypothetical protein